MTQFMADINGLFFCRKIWLLAFCKKQGERKLFGYFSFSEDSEKIGLDNEDGVKSNEEFCCYILITF